jgi:hypothetical protein
MWSIVSCASIATCWRRLIRGTFVRPRARPRPRPPVRRREAAAANLHRSVSSSSHVRPRSIPFRLRYSVGPARTSSARSVPSISHGSVSRPRVAFRTRLVIRLIVLAVSKSSLALPPPVKRERSPPLETGSTVSLAKPIVETPPPERVLMVSEESTTLLATSWPSLTSPAPKRMPKRRTTSSLIWS